MSQRSEQIAEVIHHELNNFLIKEAEPPKDTLITITGVEVTKDLEHAFINISILPINKTGTALDFFKRTIFMCDSSFYFKHGCLFFRDFQISI